MKAGMVKKERKVNRPIGVPHPLRDYSLHKKAVLSSPPAGMVDVYLGVDDLINRDLPRIVITVGQLPIERPGGLPWAGDRQAFVLDGMKVILDSYQFKTNMGRNAVLSDAFFKTVVPRIFDRVILGIFIPHVARAYARDSRYMLHIEEHLPFIRLFADVCLNSEKHGFKIPDEVLKAPFLPGGGGLFHSLAELDADKSPVYFTRDRLEGHLRAIRNLVNEENGGERFRVLSVADLPYYFRQWLEERYEARFREIRQGILIHGQDDSSLQRLAERLNRILFASDVFGGGLSSLHELMGILGAGSRRIPRIGLGRFLHIDGSPEKQTPTQLVDKNGKKVVLNMNHPRVSRMLKLFEDGENIRIGAHYVMWEILREPALSFGFSEREQLLTLDLLHRFHEEPSIPRPAPAFADDNDEDWEIDEEDLIVL